MISTKKTFALILVLMLIISACTLSTQSINNQQGNNPENSGNGGNGENSGDANGNSGDSGNAGDNGQGDEPAQEDPTNTPVPLNTPVPTDLPPTEPACTNDLQFISDITIPDGTLVSPGSMITKTWRVRNTGTCTWGFDYEWVQISGGPNLESTVDVYTLPHEVAPGATVDITVHINVAAAPPQAAPLQAQFQMRSPSGVLFGQHPYLYVYASTYTGICPLTLPNTQLLIHSFNYGQTFCFLYPDTYNLTIGNQVNTLSVRVSAPPVGQGEQVIPALQIDPQGEVDGFSIQQFTDFFINQCNCPSVPLTVETIYLDGEEGRTILGMPGIYGTLGIYLVRSDFGYVMTLHSQDPAFPAETAAATALWEMIHSSWTWTNP